MKKKLLLTAVMALMLCALFAVGVDAAEIASGTCGADGDNLTWVRTDDGTLTISGTGEMTEWRTDLDVPWMSSGRYRIKKVVIGNGVTSIGGCAFAGVSFLTDVVLPDSITSIGESAFHCCDRLTNITIPENVVFVKNFAFYYCKSLASITIPDSVTSIGTYAFSFCTSLTSITIPASVTSIGEKVFADCDSLTNITVDSENAYYCDKGGVLFNKDKTTLIAYPAGKTADNYMIVDSVTSIGARAFCNCTSLQSITIPASVSSVGKGAFDGCTNLTIYGYSGSAAETYANENGIPFLTIDDDVTAQYACKQIKIKSVESGNYVCGHNDSKVHAGGNCGSGIFEVTPLTSDGWVGIKLQTKNYISVGDDDYLQTTASDYEAWECFRIYEYDGYQYLLSQKNNKFVQVTDEEGRPLKTCIGADSYLADATWERFQIEILGDSQGMTDPKYSAKTSTLQFLTPQEAEAFIAFMYNKTRPELTQSEKENNDLYEYLTGQLPRGTDEYEYAQMMFLTLSAEAINKHMGNETGRIETSVNNLTTFLKRKMGDESGAAQEIVSACVNDVKSNCRALLLDLIGDDGTIEMFESTFNGIIDLVNVRENAQEFVDELRAMFELANLVAANDTVKAYSYYIIYVNNRSVIDIDTSSTGYSQFDVYFETLKLSVDILDALGSMFDTLGIGHAWNSDDTQHLLNTFAEFTYHSQAEFDSYVSFAKESITIADEKSYKNPATFHCVDGTNVAITYESSASYVASVSETGEITPLNPGTTLITATTSNGRKAVCTVEVLPMTGYCGSTGSGQNLIWDLDRIGTLTISGTGEMASWGSAGDVPWDSYRDSIKTVIIGGGITSIGEYAFSDCQNLTSITIPVSVASIGNYAFSGCDNLTISGYTGSAAETYANENGIPFISRGTAVPVEGISGTCGTNLTWKLTDDGTLTINGTGEMTNWGSAGAVPWDSYRPSIKTVVIESGVTTVGKYAFCDCGNLTGITIPDSVTYIYNYAFCNCDTLIRVVIPDGVAYIDEYAFYDCASLTSVVVPTSVICINKGAFTECPNLTIQGYAGSDAEYYATLVGIPFVAITDSYTLTGTAAVWNDTDNALYYLYPATVADADIRAQWTAGTYPTSGNILAAGTAGTITAMTVDGKAMYTQTFSFAGVTDGTYKLVIFKPGVYVAKITQITVSGANIDTGVQKMWLYGDVNYDGCVNEIDALQIVRRGLGKASAFDSGDDVTKAERLIAADVDGDGYVSEQDALQLVRYGLGKASVFSNYP